MSTTIALAVEGPGMDAALDPHLGRCAGFVVVDGQTGIPEYLPNTQNLEAAQGAGIQAAQLLVRRRVQALVASHCGPKAFRVLQAAGIAVYGAQELSAGQALQAWREKRLPLLSDADVPGHWA